MSLFFIMYLALTQFDENWYNILVMLVIIFAISGLLFGSFLNVWVLRTNEGVSVIRGRSVCPQCKKRLSWYENIPLVSFILQKGKCRGCKKFISLQYPLVELVIGLLFWFVAWFHSGAVEFIIRDAFILFFLTFIFVYDLKYQEIWDRMTIYPAIILVVATLWFGWLTIQSLLIGMSVGSGFFLAQYVISNGKWIGGGDIRLGLFMGVILGWPNVLLALFFAYVGGALFVLPFLILKKKHLATKVPFGSYLSIATIVAMFWGENIIQWYTAFFRF